MSKRTYSLRPVKTSEAAQDAKRVADILKSLAALEPGHARAILRAAIELLSDAAAIRAPWRS